MNWIVLIGLVAATCTTLSFLPQIIKSWKTKRTKDISIHMYSLLVFGIFLWLVYGLLINDLPLILANVTALVLSLSVLILKIKHG